MDLILGDCLDVMPNLASASVDAIIADLPFGITNCPWDSEIQLDKLWEQYKRLIKANGQIVLFSSQPFTANLIMSNPKMFKYCWYWQKERGTGFLNAKRQPLRVIEEICVFYWKTKYNPQMIPIDRPYKHLLPIVQSDINNSVASCGKDAEKKYGEHKEAYPKNILKFAREYKQLIPTQKPLSLLEYLVKTYSNESETILDNTMGSGTTGLACKNLNRKFIGIEKNPQHFEIAKNRIEK